MKQLVTNELYDYWRGLKGARRAPERNDIDLAAIRHLLAHVFILQVDPLGRFPLKMCGTRINAYWLEEQKGRSFLEFWGERDRSAVASALSTVTDDARPVVAGARSAPGDIPGIDLELLLLPLRHFGKTHSLVLGSLAPANEPAWLGRMPVRALNIHTLRVIGAGDARFACGQVQDSGPGERSRAPAGRPKLVLHEGGKSINMFA